MSDKEPSYKVIFVGDTNVGKTCIINRAVLKTYSTDIPPTNITAYSKLSINVNSTQVNLSIHDMAGQETYRTVVPMYFQSTNAVVIVYSIENNSSFDDIDAWYQLVTDKLDKNETNIYLVANKADLYNDTNNSKFLIEKAGIDKAKNLGIPFLSVSAKNDTNIDELFDTISKECLGMSTHTNAKKCDLTENNNKKNYC